ncbi:hypothetical protein KL930_004134 [Ogataea haglerorum]|nr:hypothetical protein KL914_000697 [Ogataea haglerorum]KAG7745040.1 hypothetical protein KL932_000070 [Ogataea haglerorum]KAG7774304.1 hypothetical protein KL930_004134 [Ogataea haglerorum]KAG7775592.1 hypothetical protein KL922_004242 [Ogataea haglerorum]KAG7814985.1 hypothetical protein KL924_000071 [Ogataea haglerorum]
MKRDSKRQPKKGAGHGPPAPGKPPVFAPDMHGRRYWLVKSEPMPRVDAKTGKTVQFSIADLASVESEPWDGVRNWEARNYLVQMAKDDIFRPAVALLRRQGDKRPAPVVVSCSDVCVRAQQKAESCGAARGQGSRGHVSAETRPSERDSCEREAFLASHGAAAGRRRRRRRDGLRNPGPASLQQQTDHINVR